MLRSYEQRIKVHCTLTQLLAEQVNAVQVNVALCRAGKCSKKRNSSSKEKERWEVYSVSRYLLSDMSLGAWTVAHSACLLYILQVREKIVRVRKYSNKHALPHPVRLHTRCSQCPTLPSHHKPVQQRIRYLAGIQRSFPSLHLDTLLYFITAVPVSP